MDGIVYVLSFLLLISYFKFAESNACTVAERAIILDLSRFFCSIDVKPVRKNLFPAEETKCANFGSEEFG
jgi:hypothetical protein